MGDRRRGGVEMGLKGGRLERFRFFCVFLADNIGHFGMDWRRRFTVIPLMKYRGSYHEPI